MLFDLARALLLALVIVGSILGLVAVVVVFLLGDDDEHQDDDEDVPKR